MEKTHHRTPHHLPSIPEMIANLKEPEPRREAVISRWDTVGIYGNLPEPMGIYGNLWKPMETYGMTWMMKGFWHGSIADVAFVVLPGTFMSKRQMVCAVWHLQSSEFWSFSCLPCADQADVYFSEEEEFSEYECEGCGSKSVRPAASCLFLVPIFSAVMIFTVPTKLELLL